MDRTICVMGLGYIGLPTASLLGTKGYKVFGVDVGEKIIEKINLGEVHIVEPDLDILLKSAVQSGNLKAGLEPIEADIYIIAVPTPFKGDKVPDLSFVDSATRKIAPYVKPGALVILESTSPVGTTDDIIAKILSEAGLNVGVDIFVAHCPERVLPGRILIELVKNDRIVGGINTESTKRAAEFYREFVSGEVLETTAKTAELTKLCENAFRDVNIAYANELSIICDKLDIDVWELISLANRHPRVNILQPGPGVGGHCIAVDPWFIVNSDRENSQLIRTAREVNDFKPQWIIKKIIEKANRFKSPKIACLGLAFKADIDDLRESPSLDIVRQLKQQGVAKLLIVEPNISSHVEFDLYSTEQAIHEADIILLLVDHHQFKKLPSSIFNEKILIDTRGCIRQ